MAPENSQRAITQDNLEFLLIEYGIKFILLLFFQDKLSAPSLCFTEKWHIWPSVHFWLWILEGKLQHEKNIFSVSPGQNCHKWEQHRIGICLLYRFFLREKQLKLGLGVTLHSWKVKYCSQIFHELIIFSMNSSVWLHLEVSFFKHKWQ